MTTKRATTANSAPEHDAVLASGSAKQPPATPGPAELMAMGDGETAYLRKFRAGELRAMFPQTADLHASVELFALFGASGTPLILADTREAVLTGAWDHNLSLSSVH
ncbi:COG5568 Uncharacterized small protein [Rhabdaerophilaceae bacterium]